MHKESILKRLDGKRGELLKQVLREGRGARETASEISRVAGDRGPLSRAQRRLYYLRKLDSSDASYNMTLAMRLSGALRADVLARAVAELAVRHAALRTRIGEEGGEPYQEIVAASTIPFRVEDVRSAGGLEAARARVTEEESRAFALDGGFFARATLYLCGPEDHVLALVIDHLVADGWSCGVISRDLTALYNALLLEEPAALPALPVRFIDYARWDSEREVDDSGDLAYWKQAMEGAEASVLPLDFPRPERRPALAGACHEALVGADALARLHAMAQRTNTSVYSILSATYALFLKKYSFASDVVVGTPAAGRFRWEVSDAVGFFINTVPLRYALDDARTFADLLRRVHEVNQDGFAHQSLPYEQIVAETSPGRRRQRDLVNMLVSLQNVDLPQLKLDGVRADVFSFPRQTARFDLELHFFPHADGLLLHAAYDRTLYRSETIETVARSMVSFLEQISAGEEIALADVVFPASVKSSELVAPRPSMGDPAGFVSLPREILRRAEASPHSVAIRFGAEEVTYGELCAWAKLVASRVLSDVPERARVGLVCREGPSFIVGSLAIWLSGRTMVPIDPDFPDDRIASLVRAAGAAAVLDPEADDRMPKLVGSASLLRMPSRVDVGGAQGFEPAPLEPDQTAYILYTSGSTGVPRGVTVTQQNLAGFCAALRSAFDFGPDDRWTWWHSCSFDVSVWDIWGALATGGTVYPMTRWQKRDLTELRAFIEANGITVLSETPSAFYELIPAMCSGRRAAGAERHPSLRYVFLGGEALAPQRLRPWFEAFDDEAPRIVNGYGITETTVFSTFRRLGRDDAQRRWIASPIGEPLPNVSMRVEDAFGDVVPVGGQGEVVIAGESVSAGYLDAPELTAQKFALRDWARGAEKFRSYKSGDLGRIGSDGEVYVAGRIDKQVKLRGIRVEPGEIEARILENRRVGAAVVQPQVLDGGEGQTLVAYLVPARRAREQWARSTETWGSVFDAAYCSENEGAEGVAASAHPEWTSSFTGERYGEEVMAEWIESAVERILSLKPRRVLEIGCGGGLLFRRIAQSVEHYCGLDVSSQALRRCEALAREMGLSAERYRLERGDAHAVAGLDAAGFDLVVLNSVVQYFPDVGYLVEALDLAREKLADGGAIFVGDVRDLRRREAFYRDVERARNPGRSGEELERAVRERAERESELLVHPDFFSEYGAAASLPSARILAKESRHRTEMSGYRYDAIVSASPAPGGSRALRGLPGVGGARLSGARDWSRHANEPFDPRGVVDELRRELAAKLPDFMVPGAFVVLSELPRTVSGKIDRRALPLPTPTSRPAAAGARAKGDALEEGVAALWERSLGRADFDWDDNFFDLGGHSLKAASLCSQMEAQLGVSIGLRAMLAAPTPRGVSELVRAALARGDRAPTSNAEARAVPGQSGERSEPFPLTDVQHAYWIGRQNLMSLGNVAAHNYLEIEAGALDVARFSRAWRSVVEKHGMLRCVFTKDGQQQILESVPEYEVRVHALEGLPPREQQEALDAVRARLAFEIRPADVWPLFSLEVSRLAAGRHRLHVSVDVLPLDGQSWQIVAADLARAYQSGADLPRDTELSFRDYVLALEELKASPRYAKSLRYWQERAATLPPGPQLTLAKAEAQADQRSWKRLHHRVAPGAWKAIKQAAGRRRLTASVVLAAAYARALAHHAKSPHLCLNVTLFNRLDLHPDVDKVAGDFTSLIPLEVHAPPRERFADLAKRVEAQLWQDLDHRAVSGVRVLREMSRRQGAEAAKLPVVFTSTLSLDGKSALDGLSEIFGGQMGYGISQTPQVWLDHQVVEAGGALLCNWDYVEDLFPLGFIEEVFRAYVAIVESLADEQAWGREPEVRHRPAAGECDAAAADRTLHEDFVAWARREPDRAALCYDGQRTSYGALLANAAAVAQALLEAGIASEAPVLVACESPPAQVSAVLGTLLAGGSYVPLAASLPEARIGEIQRIVGAKLALTDLPHDVFGGACRVVRVEVDGQRRAAFDPSAFPSVRPDALAYTLFTSGSTGEPKGVAMQHRAAQNTIDAMNAQFGVRADDRVLALSALGFDLSVYDIFGVLGAGGALVYPHVQRRRDPEEWDRVVREHGVTLWNSVPALGQMYSDHLRGLRQRLPGSIAQVWWSGDWIPVDLPEAWRALADREVRLVSLGGATEAGIWSIAYEIGRVDEAWSSIPYGKSLPRQSVDVLDSECRPRPAWVVGEIGISGASLAREYFGKPELTRERFVHDGAGRRWYRTGDLGRMLPDGNIEFLGREDGQVKIRGHRIETSEIEARLGRAAFVSESAVIAWGKGKQKTELVAFASCPAGFLGALRSSSREVELPKPFTAGSTPSWLPAESAIELVIDRQRRISFKDGKAYARRTEGPALGLALSSEDKKRDLRRSHRRFKLAPVERARFAKLLSPLAAYDVEGSRLRSYGSAGTLYPVQTYVSVKPGRVSGVPAGVYYLDPNAEDLFQVSGARLSRDGFEGANQLIFDECAFAVFFVAHWPAIAPIYGELSLHFATLEAGAMNQLLESRAREVGLGLVQIGTMDRRPVAEACGLGADAAVLHCTFGGVPDDRPGGSLLFATDSKRAQRIEARISELADAEVEELVRGLGGAAPSAGGSAAARRWLLGLLARDHGLDLRRVSAVVGGDAERLRAALSAELPDYMVPHRFVFLDRLPLNANGKVDRNALARHAADTHVESGGEGPATETEKHVAAVVGQVLGLERLDVLASFFDLGGDSVSAVRVMSILNAHHGVGVSVAAMFEAPTIRSLAKHIDALRANRAAEPARTQPAGNKEDIRARRKRMAARRTSK